MADLTIDDIRIDRAFARFPGVIFVDAAAEMTRYNCCFTLDAQRDEWFVTCENLAHGLPALPHLQGWHWTYIASKVRGENSRTGMALALLMQYVYDTFVAPPIT